ncbi:MAG: potassium-transporting ATPase subunit KdpC [Desulfovibrionaceae bacterium]|nr:potassium-transporting ATPase subunit KdpC [Desulfovibrionaceae bacterium]MBF0512546.1 potassium-transporting ATPase subunit KdpC [Desulfovibrionaceae bacterium]
MFKTSLSQCRPAVVMLLVLTVLTGLAYPSLVAGLAHILFPRQAEGSLIEKDGVIVGSEFIGQPFSGDGYFWSRPSATSPNPYNASSSGGSNLGPANEDLLKSAADRAQAFRKANGGAQAPVDMVTASASGLDPHITPAAALAQAPRVAAGRGLPEEAVRGLVLSKVEGRQLGILGEPRVNVLALNMALDLLAVKK